MPVISKSFELQIQVGGGKGSNKVRILATQLVFSLSERCYSTCTQPGSGADLGGVQGVRAPLPPRDEAFFFVYTYSLLKFFTHRQ